MAESLDELIARHATVFADQVREAAKMADTEEDIRIAIENQLAFIKKEAGITLTGKYEETVASGRIDSVYDRVIIEYKNPASKSDQIGPKADSPGTKKVVEQIKKRFCDLRQELGHKLNTLFGVGTDGRYFVFIRYRDDKWQVQDPVEVNKYSAERFLWALYNLGQKGKPFSAEYLAGDFGSEAKLAQDGIKALYDAIKGAEHPKAQTFFNQWKILFGEVCGYDVDSPSDKIKKLAQYYGIPEKGLAPAEMLFAVHTYYAVFMKLLASEILAFFHKLPTPLNKMMQAPSSAKLKRAMEELEAGSIFRHLNITNFLEGDLFAWYLNVWSEQIDELIRKMVTKLDDYNPGTMSEDPVGSRDLLKKLYQQLFPKSVRRDLGEYYTPDWLAEHVLNELEYVGDPDKRILDPACGSGTFLVLAIARIRRWYEERREKHSFDEGDLCRKILANVVGFDLNPLAVMAARTNYLIAIRDLIGPIEKVEIPIYLCDSILTPCEYGEQAQKETYGRRMELKTGAMATPFYVPREVTRDRRILGQYTNLLADLAPTKSGYSAHEFLKRVADEGLPCHERDDHVRLFAKLRQLDEANKDGVWARIIKNYFAPLFEGRFDYVAGNPPWLVWDNLPTEYRDSTKPLWEKYGLFSLSASAARHGGGKKDLSMLMLYSSMDWYLNDGGLLGFVITQTLFQTKGAGDGFRRFRLGKQGPYLGVLQVNDMVRFQPFDGASNWTSTVLVKKGIATEWPVAYRKWDLVDALPNNSSRDWKEYFNVEECIANPIDSGKENSPWIIQPRGLSIDILKKVSDSDYHAHLGANSGGANGVFWVRILHRQRSEVVIQNVSEKSKSELESVTCAIEPRLLYPLIRWKDITRYSAAPSVYLILAQNVETRTGIAESEMRSKWPKTYAYLRQFKDLLPKRAAYRRYQGDASFYSMYDIGVYTLAPIKVVWRRMDSRINAAVVTEVVDPFLGSKPVVPQETCVLVECDSEDEAHYICAYMNSLVVNYVVKSHSVRGGKGFGTPSMLDFIGLKRFRQNDATHQRLSRLGRNAHDMAAKGDIFDLVQAEIDETVASLWGVGKKKLSLMRRATE